MRSPLEAERTTEPRDGVSRNDRRETAAIHTACKQAPKVTPTHGAQPSVNRAKAASGWLSPSWPEWLPGRVSRPRFRSGWPIWCCLPGFRTPDTPPTNTASKCDRSCLFFKQSI